MLKIISFAIIVSLIHSIMDNSLYQVFKYKNKLSYLQYFIFMLSSIGFIMLMLQPTYNLIIFQDISPIIIRILCGTFIIKLLTIPKVLNFIQNPDSEENKKFLSSLHLEEDELMEKRMKKVKQIKKKQKKLLKQFYIELRELEKNSINDTEEELKIKIDALTMKYNKLIEDCKKVDEKEI